MLWVNITLSLELEFVFCTYELVLYNATVQLIFVRDENNRTKNKGISHLSLIARELRERI